VSLQWCHQVHCPANVGMSTGHWDLGHRSCHNDQTKHLRSCATGDIPINKIVVEWYKTDNFFGAML